MTIFNSYVKLPEGKHKNKPLINPSSSQGVYSLSPKRHRKKPFVKPAQCLEVLFIIEAETSQHLHPENDTM